MESVGEIVLDVEADGSGLPAEVKRAAQIAAKGVKIQIPADLNEKGLAAEVAATAKALSGYATIEIEADLKAKKLAAEVAALKRSLGKLSFGNIPTELRSAISKSTYAAKRAAEAQTIRIAATADFTEAEKELSQFRARRQFAEQPIEVPVKIDPRGDLLVQIQKLKRQITESESIRIELDLDAAREGQRLRGIVKNQVLSRLDDLRTQQIDIAAKVRADLAPLQQQLRDLNAEVNAEVDLDTTAAKVDFESFKAAIDNETVQLHLEARPDVLSARMASDAMRAAVNESPIRIPIEVDGSALDFGQTRLRLFQRSAEATARVLKSVGNAVKGMKFVVAIGTVLRYFAASVSLIAVAAGIALPYIKALGALVAFLALQFLAAASAAGTFVAGGFLAVGAAAATAAIGVMGLETAFDALAKIWARQDQGLTKGKKNIEASKEEIKAYEAALRALHPEAREFVRAIDTMRPAFRQLQLAVQGTLFKGLGDQLRTTFGAILPSLRTGFLGIAGVLNTMAINTLKWIRSAEGVKMLNDLFRISKDTLEDLGTAAGNFALGLLTLFIGSEESINSMSGGLVTLSEKFKDWTREITKDGSWEGWLADGRAVLEDLGRAITGVKNIAVGFWKAISGDEDATFVDLVDTVADKLEEWGNWMKDPANKEAIRSWVADAKSNLEDLAEALQTILDLLEKIAAVIKWLKENQIFTGGVPEGQPLPQTLPDDAPIRKFWEWLKKISGQHFVITLDPVLGPVPQPERLDPIPWPIEPKLGPMPANPNLSPIQWPIIPKLGPILRPILEPIFWPISPRFGPIVYPILSPGLWPIISEWKPVPSPPELIRRVSRIISEWLPNPSPPKLVRRVSRIISEWAAVPDPPYIAPIYVDIIPVYADAQGEVIGSPLTARGISVTNGPQLRVVGEAGPEAIVPLTRTQPLDPGVRALLGAVASARGIGMQPTAKGKDRIDPTINVMLPTGDPEAAAMSVWNRLVFEGVV